jgi:transposase
MPGSSRKYPPELRERAVRMVTEIRGEQESEWAAMARVAELLGVTSTETVRQWVRRAEVDAGQRPGTTSEESAELKRLRREVAELKRANAILKAGGCRTNPRRDQWRGSREPMGGRRPPPRAVRRVGRA